MVTFKKGTGSSSGRWVVYVDGQYTGSIRKREEGWQYTRWQYTPGQRQGGEFFPTLQQCKDSLTS